MRAAVTSTGQERHASRRAILVDHARIQDAAEISGVLSANFSQRGLFQISASRVSSTISDFVVARDRTGRIVGCAAVHRDGAGLAQLHSVAVLPGYQNADVGKRLISAAVQSAASAGIKRLWGATEKPVYFAYYGFRPISRWRLPIRVLLRQLVKVLHQPVARIPGLLFGRHTFMERHL
jgi:amino-acid N-acetyltransferase